MNNPLTSITIVYVVLLVILGVGGYLVTGRQSFTALIPAFFAIVVLLGMAILQRVASQTVLRWILIALAVVGLAATASGIPKVITMLSGGEVARPSAAISQAIMAILSLAYGIVLLLTKRP